MGGVFDSPFCNKEDSVLSADRTQSSRKSKYFKFSYGTDYFRAALVKGSIVIEVACTDALGETYYGTYAKCDDAFKYVDLPVIQACLSELLSTHSMLAARGKKYPHVVIKGRIYTYRISLRENDITFEYKDTDIMGDPVWKYGIVSTQDDERSLSCIACAELIKEYC